MLLNLMRNFDLDCGICTNVYNPVCSVEGVEYYNPCWAVCGMDKIECSHKCPCSKQTAKNRNQEQETTPEDYEIGNLPECLFDGVIISHAFSLGIGFWELLSGFCN